MYTKEEIIKLAREVHGDKYDYSLVKNVQNKLGKIQYKCIKHNFIHEQTLYNHLQGKGCPLCAKEKRIANKKLSKEEFINKVSKKRNDLDKYDFDKTDFSFRDEYGRMEIYCKKHGRFLIRPSHFINGSEGCKFCNGREKNDEEVKKILSKLHPTLDFSQTKYSERDKYGNIKVICPKHGEKMMRYWNLMHGEGCYECAMKEFGLNSRLSNEEIIKRAKEIYGENKYTYEKLDTKNRSENNKVIITCPKHGDFLVNLGNFLCNKSGCPICRNSKLELKISNFLIKNNIRFEKEKTFEWLKYKSNLYLDFYLPDYKIVIECQGIQHFHAVESFGGEIEFLNIKKRDRVKKKLCEENGIKVLYYMKKEYVKNKNDFSSLREIIKEIKCKEK